MVEGVVEIAEKAARDFWASGFHVDEDSDVGARKALAKDFPEADEVTSLTYRLSFLEWIRRENERLGALFWEDWCRQSFHHDDEPEFPGP